MERGSGESRAAHSRIIVRTSHRIAVITAIARREVKQLAAIAERRAAELEGARAASSFRPLTEAERWWAANSSQRSHGLAQAPGVLSCWYEARAHLQYRLRDYS